MKKALVLLAIVFTATPLWAQKIKVRKVKGNQAVVEFTGDSLKSGGVYELQQDEFSLGGSPSGGGREHLIGVSFSFLSGKSDAAGSESTTTIDLDARYGWNMGVLEFGPILRYESNNAINSTLYAAGAFADFNLVPNAPGEVFLYGLGGVGIFGNNDPGTGKSGMVMDFGVGPQVKWFGLAGNFCFRFDLLYRYVKDDSGASSSTYTGFQGKVGIANYF